MALMLGVFLGVVEVPLQHRWVSCSFFRHLLSGHTLQDALNRDLHEFASLGHGDTRSNDDLIGYIPGRQFGPYSLYDLVFEFVGVRVRVWRQHAERHIIIAVLRSEE